MSGKLAGNVHARNRYGNYIRANTKPTNPNTDRQVVVRATVAFLAERWGQTVTALQRTAWDLYAASVAMKNKLGETIHLSGFNHYIRSNSILKRSGRALVDAGPVVFELPEQDPTFSMACAQTDNKGTFTYDDTMEWCDETDAWMHMFMGKPQNPQINFFDGPWRLYSAVAGNNGAPPASPGESAAPWAMSEGQRIWVYGRITRADGRLSQPFRSDCIVTA